MVILLLLLLFVWVLLTLKFKNKNPSCCWILFIAFGQQICLKSFSIFTKLHRPHLQYATTLICWSFFVADILPQFWFIFTAINCCYCWCIIIILIAIFFALNFFCWYVYRIQCWSMYIVYAFYSSSNKIKIDYCIRNWIPSLSSTASFSWWKTGFSSYLLFHL